MTKEQKKILNDFPDNFEDYYEKYIDISEDGGLETYERNDITKKTMELYESLRGTK